MMSAFNQTKQTIIANEVDKANTTIKRMRGLLGKKTMQSDFGLWISPCRSIHTFFMKFPIDVVFLSSSNQVVKLLKSIPPFRLSSWVYSSQSVLELSTGSIESSKTSVGDQIIFLS